jgi:pimeloyl-ACP methyl ester carboxylesterase
MPTTGTAGRDGACLHWESEGDGPPVLLIMGLGMSATGWWRTVPALSQRFCVISFDGRGIGRSSPLRGINTMEAMADDAVAVLDAACVDAAHVYGFSMGGMVAQHLALRHRERVRSLVMGGTHPGGSRSVRADRDTQAYLRRRPSLYPEEAAWASVPYNYGPTCRRHHAGRIADDIAQRLRYPSAGRTYRAQFAAAVLHNAYRRLAAIDVPTLVVHGELDRMVPAANGELIAERVPGAQLHLVPGAGHFYMTDEPAVEERIEIFLAEAG